MKNRPRKTLGRLKAGSRTSRCLTAFVGKVVAAESAGVVVWRDGTRRFRGDGRPSLLDWLAHRRRRSTWKCRLTRLVARNPHDEQKHKRSHHHGRLALPVVANLAKSPPCGEHDPERCDEVGEDAVVRSEATTSRTVDHRPPERDRREHADDHPNRSPATAENPAAKSDQTDGCEHQNNELQNLRHLSSIARKSAPCLWQQRATNGSI